MRVTRAIAGDSLSGQRPFRHAGWDSLSASAVAEIESARPSPKSAYLLLRFLHLVGAFGFVAAHGATAAVTVKLRRERNPARVRAYLELSRSTRGLMYGSFVLLLGAGIALASIGGWWSTRWLWTALALLTLLFVAAFPLALPYFGAIRRVVESEPVDEKRLSELLGEPRGLILAWVESLGILAILYLMVFKPF